MGTTPQPPSPSCPAHISGFETDKFTHKRWAASLGGETWQIDPIQVSCPTEPWGGSAVEAALLSSAEVLPLTWIQL